MTSRPYKSNGCTSGNKIFNHAHTNGTNHHSPKKKRLSINENQPKLPIFHYKERFLRLMNENDSLVVIGETGSGKTTQLPQWCVEFCQSRLKNLKVACTQPRRIAAMSVATRVAKEMGVNLGDDVGYSVRFENLSSSKTTLKYLTDGMLLREGMLDSMLTSYGVVIIDEAHERTLQTEILCGVIKRAMKIRNDKTINLLPLKVIVMSATIKADLFTRYFNCPALMIEGRQHTVQDMFAEIPQTDLLTSTIIAVFQVHRTCKDGDILVFCSGQDEIQSLLTICKKTLKQAPESLQNMIALPLYAALPTNQQLQVFERNKPIYENGNSKSPGNGVKKIYTRRVIFATNVAETSITIPDIKYVIDTGKMKCRNYCPNTGLESLKVTTISKSQANQRSGRAGRVSSGTCYRLYTTEEYEAMAEYPTPEIKRSNLDTVLLQMVSMSITDIYSFDFLEKPNKSQIMNAEQNLLHLGAVKKMTGKTGLELTELGKKICTFPLNPQMSRIILSANDLGCLDEILTIVSLLCVDNLFFIPPNKQNQAETVLAKFSTNEGDAIMLLKVFRAFKKVNLLNKAGLKQWIIDHFIHAKNLKMAILIRRQLLDLCKSMRMSSSSCGQDTALVRQALAHGLYKNVAKMCNGKYKSDHLNEIYIHPNSCLFKTKPECIIYVEIVETNKCYMRNCTLVDPAWIREIIIR